jgi:nicotinamide mononucleotide transporter
MSPVFNFFWEPYAQTPIAFIAIEFIAMAFGIISVFYAKKENIWVYPTGIISTGLYVYLLAQWQMYGDLIINIYYTLMSLYGWWMWSKVVNQNTHSHLQITRNTLQDNLKSIVIFVFTSVFVIAVYRYHNVMPNHLGFTESIQFAWENISSGKLENIRKAMPFLDTFTTGAAFVAMWLMANKKLESWSAWIIVNTASIPLYFIKGYGFTGIQYTIFLILAFYGYKEWKQILNKNQSTLSK